MEEEKQIDVAGNPSTLDIQWIQQRLIECRIQEAEFRGAANTFDEILKKALGLDDTGKPIEEV